MATLFSGGLIFDGNELVEDHSVLVEDGIISRFAPTSEFVGFDGWLIHPATHCYRDCLTVMFI